MQQRRVDGAAGGLPVTHREFVSGPDYLQWQGSLGWGLVALLAPRKWQVRAWQLARAFKYKS